MMLCQRRYRDSGLLRYLFCDPNFVIEIEAIAAVRRR